MRLPWRERTRSHDPALALARGAYDNFISDPRASPDWRYSSLAVQPKLGTISERRPGTSLAYRGDPDATEGLLMESTLQRNTPRTAETFRDGS